jgi:NAD(P)-dependent dehydrogenase (short-subunit alcohol dehydrogenase family)
MLSPAGEFEMDVTGRAFLITGGGSGLGAATARRLAAAGAKVLVVDRDAKSGAAVVDEIGEAARFAEADVTDTMSIQRAIDAAIETFGGLNGVVHCAGIVAAGRVLGKQGPHDLELFAKVVNVNLVGTFNVVRLVAAAMAKSPAGDDGERGVIVLTSSIAAYDGQIGQAAYAASKGGVASMTLPLARDLARHGIRVVTIAPGIFDTPMMAGMSDEVRSSLAAEVPFPKRLGHPDEFAALAQHAIENSMLNGEVVRLDGAARMPAK